jgi:hypothetical protein
MGRHQAGNAPLALRAVEAIAARDEWALDEDAGRPGLLSATLPGRFGRRLINGRTVVRDGAHDPMKLAAADRGTPTAVERNPATAVSRAVEDADGVLPVVVSGSLHLLAAVHGATVSQ